MTGDWRAPRPGESVEQATHRVAQSCYRCGVHIVDRWALARHEDDCSAVRPVTCDNPTTEHDG